MGQLRRLGALRASILAGLLALAGAGTAVAVLSGNEHKTRPRQRVIGLSDLKGPAARSPRRASRAPSTPRGLARPARRSTHHGRVLGNHAAAEPASTHPERHGRGSHPLLGQHPVRTADAHPRQSAASRGPRGRQPSVADRGGPGGRLDPPFLECAARPLAASDGGVRQPKRGVQGR